MNGMVIGAPQTFNYFRDVQNRIIQFVCKHCRIKQSRLEELMMETQMLTKDVDLCWKGKRQLKKELLMK